MAYPANTESVAGDQLRAFIERIERLETEADAIKLDVKEVKAEARGNGFDVKVINRLIRIRKQDPAKRQEEEAILEIYMAALGMIAEPSED